MMDSGGELQSFVQHHRATTAMDDFYQIYSQFAQQGDGGSSTNVIGISIMDPISKKVNISAIREIFHAFDLDGNGVLDDKEVERFASVLFRTGNLNVDDEQAEKMRKDLTDELKDAQRASMEHDIEKNTGGCMAKKEKPKDPNENSIGENVFIMKVAQVLEEELANQATEDEDEELDVGDLMTTQCALFYIFLGTGLVTLFSDGVVNAIDAFGANTGIPNFVLGFVVCPFASNASEFISSLQFACAKKRQNMSVTFNQIYAACTMNNTLCLGVLLLLIYVKELEWDYTAEVGCILLTTWIIGLTAVGTTVKYWYAGFAVIIYPISLVFVEVCHAFGVN